MFSFFPLHSRIYGNEIIFDCRVCIMRHGLTACDDVVQLFCDHGFIMVSIICSVKSEIMISDPFSGLGNTLATNVISNTDEILKWLNCAIIVSLFL